MLKNLLNLNKIINFVNEKCLTTIFAKCIVGKIN